MVLDSMFNPVVDIFWHLIIKMYINFSKKIERYHVTTCISTFKRLVLVTVQIVDLLLHCTHN